MRLKKTYDFIGTVQSANGLWRNRVIGKPVKGIITVTGDVDDLGETINREFQIGGKVTEAPLIGEGFPGGNMQCDDFPYVVTRLEMADVINLKSVRIYIMMKIIPWTKIVGIRVTGSPKSWIKRILLDNVGVDGEAILSKSEEVKVNEKGTDQ